jgi:CubicO group peptidase (beta-lactamase class C family)
MPKTYRNKRADSRSARRYLRAALILGAAALMLLFTTSPVGVPTQAVLLPARVIVSAPALPAARAVAAPAPTLGPPTARPAARPSATPIPVITATPASTALGATGTAIDRYVSELVDAGIFQGVVLVARDGQMLLNRGYGFADRARRVPNTPQTRFQLASMTKQFTATAIMLLRARGLLRIDDTICTYLDHCPAAWQTITIQQLLTHTSGLPNYTDLATFDATQMLPTTPDELVGRFRDLPLLFPPGSRYMYENSDYVLLGTIIERVTGQPYAEVLRDAIFQPLGMHDTGADQRAGGEAAWAAGYNADGTLAPAIAPSTLFSAGELYSTSEDLYRWDQALYTNKLLPQAQLNEMWTPLAADYGYGWKINTYASHRKISHSGLIDGFAGTIARYPDDHVTVIVLCNLSGADVDGIGDYIATLVFNHDP